MKAILKSVFFLGVVGGVGAQASVPLLYCQDLPTEDLEVVEVSLEDQGTEILSRFRDGRTSTVRLGFKMELRDGTRIALDSVGTKRRELFLAPGGWVLRVFDGLRTEQFDALCD